MKNIKENHKFLKDPHIAINWKGYRDEGRKYLTGGYRLLGCFGYSAS
jgi:hypothetical protein